MSDNIYPKDLIEAKDLDLYQFGGRTSGQTRRPKVEFNVGHSFGESSFERPEYSGISSINRINKSLVKDMKDISEPDMKIAVVVLDSVNTVTQHLLSHPFVVIRRQTQVSRKSTSYHLMPFSVFAFMVRIQSKQGFGVLWKGITSVFITKAMQIGFESIIAELTPFVRDFSSKRLTFEVLFQHLVLKGMAIVLVTPFLCSSCAETVQSSIASENPGVFDSITEGFCRIYHWKMDRKLPIWLLCGPTLAYHLSHYLISSSVRKALINFKNNNQNNEKENINKYNTKYNEIVCSFWGTVVADVILFPLQTIIMRLFLQGTRTIIDNVSQPNAVTPIISDYESPTDCFQTIVKEEGRLGLFKGMGALVLQYSIHYSLLRLTKYCLKKTISGLKDE